MKNWLSLLLFVAWAPLASVIPNKPHIYVEGSAEFGVYPDQIMISVSLSSINRDADVAKSDIDSKSLKLFSALKEIGLKQQDITATPLQIMPEFDYENGKRISKGTKVSRNVDVKLQDISKYPLLNDTLVKAAITSKISSIAKVSNEKAVKKKALMLALKDARLKAQSLAELQNKVILDVHSISEFKTRKEDAYTLRPQQEIYGQSYANAEMRFRTPPPPAGVFEIGEMKVSATVYVVYLIE